MNHTLTQAEPSRYTEMLFFEVIATYARKKLRLEK
jgi:hypothetical protein